MVKQNLYKYELRMNISCNEQNVSENTIYGRMLAYRQETIVLYGSIPSEQYTIEQLLWVSRILFTIVLKRNGGRITANDNI